MRNAGWKILDVLNNLAWAHVIGGADPDTERPASEFESEAENLVEGVANRIWEEFGPPGAD